MADLIHVTDTRNHDHSSEWGGGGELLISP